MTLPALRERLRSGTPLLATFSIIPSVEVVELVALAGFDAIIIDLEHGAHGSEALGPLILAARARGIYPLVRVRSSEPQFGQIALSRVSSPLPLLKNLEKDCSQQGQYTLLPESVSAFNFRKLMCSCKRSFSENNCR
jgi:hypothetical protein